jgi:penicillin-binding protein 1C
MYASMARTLLNYSEHPGSKRYSRADFHPANFIQRADSLELSELEATSWLSAAAIYQTLDVLTEVHRPGEESGWKYFTSSRKIAWKTGTSFGLRDGWAVGVTPEYTIGVWVGNADGEGRPGLTGTDAAAPLMFDMFSLMDGKTWFAKPVIEMTEITVCAKSGQRNSPLCPETNRAWVVKAGLESQPCPYHKLIHLDPKSDVRVNADCEPLSQSRDVTWFVLPPAQEHFFKNRNVSYRSLPPFRPDCQVTSSMASMDLLYPKPNARILVPRNLDGTAGEAVFELAHRNPEVYVHWHLDGRYLASTRKRHFLPLNPIPGKHVLVVVDESGESIEQQFEVIPRL